MCECYVGNAEMMVRESTGNQSGVAKGLALIRRSHKGLSGNPGHDFELILHRYPGLSPFSSYWNDREEANVGTMMILTHRGLWPQIHRDAKRCKFYSDKSCEFPAVKGCKFPGVGSFPPALAIDKQKKLSEIIFAELF